MTSHRFRYCPVPTLPRLAWLAELRAGSAETVVYHGPWVETAPTAFCEGAWDGPFAEQRFDRAATFLGSGARLAADGVTFSSATHLFERLYAVRHGDRLLISNSLVFLLAHSGDGFDLGYPNTYFDLLDYDRQGYRNTRKTLHTRNGATVRLLEHGNFRVDSNLTVQRREKAVLPPPRGFADYRDKLLATLAAVAGNAAAAGRRQTFRLLASASRGYDSTAIAALVRTVGGREALTFAAADGVPLADDGSAIARHLGLAVTAYDRTAYRRLAQPAEPEFLVCPTGTTIPLAAAEAQLQGAIYCTGRYADLAWEPDEKNMLPYLLWPTTNNRSGATYEEFRLRTGFVHFPIPGVMISYSHELYQLSVSREMQPWSLPSAYNKPIPRRLAEEAGVPRALFGQEKMASAHAILEDGAAFHPAAWGDFQAFLAAHPEHAAVLAAQRLPLRRALDRARKGGVQLARRRLPYRLYRRWVLTLPLVAHRAESALWGRPFLYTLHWGYERVRGRYAIEALRQPDAGGGG